MYAANNNSSTYSTTLTPNSATVNDPYHWEHAMHAHSHNRIPVSGHSNESLWYSDSMLCQPEQIMHNPISSMDDNIHRKSQNYHQPAPTYSALHQSAGPRAVIPSKRAAQNRAAQRAFRQRKERYVKDLEKKAKLMDEWKAEMDQLRQQNQELRDCNMNLEKQIHKLNSSLDPDQQKKLISPIHSPNLTAAEIIPAPVVMLMDQPTVKSTRRIQQQPQRLQDKYQAAFMPVNLRAPDHASFIGSPTTSCSSSSSSSSFNGLEDISGQPATAYHPNQIPWTTPASNDFDHYNASYDFMSGGQALDDLCAILQTRQRSEAYNYSGNNNTLSYAVDDHHHQQQQQQQNETMLLARSY